MKQAAHRGFAAEFVAVHEFHEGQRKPAMLKLITSAEQAYANILRFAPTLKNNTAMQARLSYARAWYACQDESGAWHFAPAKFAGYQNIEINEYLDAGNENCDGRRTEAQLRMFFDAAELDEPIHAESTAALFAFLAKYGKSPSVRVRVHVLKTRPPVRREPILTAKIASETPALCSSHHRRLTFRLSPPRVFMLCSLTAVPWSSISSCRRRRARSVLAKSGGCPIEEPRTFSRGCVGQKPTARRYVPTADARRATIVAGERIRGGDARRAVTISP
jgi:hypothetical protein